MLGPAVLDHLYSDQAASGEIYALVDAARDARIHPRLARAGLEQCCLFDGELPEVLAQAAPYLLRLQPWAPLAEWLLSTGWGGGWMTLFSARASLRELRRHFRTLLLVRDEAGRTMYFRFYDPRVLALYLPTCTDEERRAVFGPVDRFWLEGAKGRQLIAHRGDGVEETVFLQERPWR